jgi:hypothetical protein
VGKFYTNIEVGQDSSKKRKRMAEEEGQSKKPKKRIKNSQTRKGITLEAHPSPRTRESIESHSQTLTNQDCPQRGGQPILAAEGSLCRSDSTFNLLNLNHDSIPLELYIVLIAAQKLHF